MICTKLTFMDGFCDLTDTNVERSVNEAKGVETIAFKGAPERIQRERRYILQESKKWYFQLKQLVIRAF